MNYIFILQQIIRRYNVFCCQESGTVRFQLSIHMGSNTIYNACLVAEIRKNDQINEKIIYI